MSAEKKKTPKNGSPVSGEPDKKKAPKIKLSTDKKKIQDLKNQVNELEDRRLRLKAEFENFRKRRDKDMLRMLEYEGEEILKNLLPIVDDLERVIGALKSDTKKDDIMINEGIKLIITKIDKYFKKWQVEPIGKPGDILDVDLHDAMMVKSEKGKKKNEILEVFEKGYKYKDHVLRHAKVVVNK
ncbi:MAG: nucleotide exchange factor GrpE [Candidatus Neomarinimicrobiota bacterium]